MANDPRNRDLSDLMVQRLALVKVERAIYDLRRGLPVLISDSHDSGSLVASSELADSETLALLEALSGERPQLHITHRRAETLKIRLYTEGAISLVVDEADPLAFITHLSNPARDLDFPLSGPFKALRETPPRSKVASLRLAKLAGLLPSTLSVQPGFSQTGPAKSGNNPCETWALNAGLLCVSAKAIESYERDAATSLEPVSQITDAVVPLADAANTRIVAFRPQGADGGGPEHLAIVIGAIDAAKPVLVRLHSECFTGDLLGSLKCDCGEQLRGAISAISTAGSGILLYLAQEGRGIGLMNKLRAYQLQDQGFDTVEANLRLGFEVDERLFQVAAEMLRQLGVHDVHLLTNNPDKVSQLVDCNIKVSKRVPHSFPTNEHNAHYLATKAEKTGHLL